MDGYYRIGSMFGFPPTPLLPPKIVMPHQEMCILPAASAHWMEAAAAVHSAADNIFHVGRVSDVRSVRQILRGQIPARDIGIPNGGNTNELLLQRGKHVRPET